VLTLEATGLKKLISERTSDRFTYSFDERQVPKLAESKGNASGGFVKSWDFYFRDDFTYLVGFGVLKPLLTNPPGFTTTF
jgi:hypothetical protein